jgi:hypothetical protein
MKVPAFREPGLTRFLTDMIQERELGDDGKLDKGKANHSILLQSSGGKVYEITVDDAGVLMAVLVAG